MADHNDKKPFYYKRWFIVLVVIIIISVLASIGNKHNTKPVSGQASPAASGNQAQKQLPPTALTAPSSAAPSVSPSTISVKKQLISGHYTAGIDFPAGTYDIVAVSGKGNVYSSNMYSGGINAAMGVEDSGIKPASGMYAQKYSKIKLTDGVVLSVSGGVVIQISSNDAKGTPLSSRNQTITDKIHLRSGKFIAGKDFPAGTYDVIAISGSGNVYSDNMYNGGINAAMGTEAENKAAGMNLYEQRYNHIEFPEGIAITINGVEIQFVPST